MTSMFYDPVINYKFVVDGSDVNALYPCDLL